MANTGPNMNASQFYITTRGDDLAYLDGKHTLFGEVAEGLAVLDAINQLYVDKENRPFQDVRIKHTHVLDDPFPDPALLVLPPHSPVRERPESEVVEPRVPADEPLEPAADGRSEAELEQSVRAKEAKSRAVVLEMIGDLPDADVKPPEEVLFVCKLNPVTASSDLDMAFCRFGPCKSDVIRDYKTGDSLCFAFIEFTDAKHCEEAYFKMNNVLLDDRRIKVDFSQSVSKLWNKVARRPWEKHSKSDGDPYTREKSGGKRGELFGKRDLQLKPTKRHPGDAFELVADEDEGEDVDKSRRGGHRSSRPPARTDRGGGDRSHTSRKRSPSRDRSRDSGRRRAAEDRGKRHRSRSHDQRDEKKESSSRSWDAKQSSSRHRDRGRERGHR